MCRVQDCLRPFQLVWWKKSLLLTWSTSSWTMRITCSNLRWWMMSSRRRRTTQSVSGEPRKSPYASSRFRHANFGVTLKWRKSAYATDHNPLPVIRPCFFHTCCIDEAPISSGTLSAQRLLGEPGRFHPACALAWCRCCHVKPVSFLGSGRLAIPAALVAASARRRR